MIANARMYAVSPATADQWHALLSAVFARARLPVDVIDYPAPAPLEGLWQRTDGAAVFMCGLPFSLAAPRPLLVAAPVPSPLEFGGAARYWSDFVVRDDSPYHTVAGTFGGRLALTVPGSQSGCVAALSYFMPMATAAPLFSEIVSPTITPLGALTAVVDGTADIAPIDAYALRLLERYRPELTVRVRRVGRTESTPIPPLVAAAAAIEGVQLENLRSAFLEAHQDASIKPVMNSLLLEGFVYADPAEYGVLLERFTVATRYWASHRLAVVTDPAFIL